MRVFVRFSGCYCNHCICVCSLRFVWNLWCLDRVSVSGTADITDRRNMYDPNRFVKNVALIVKKYDILVTSIKFCDIVPLEKGEVAV